MNIFDFIDNHPIVTVIILYIVCVTIDSIFENIFRKKT